jgi:predicted TIM-barrel fold metal-dependent hydrolase
MLPRRDFLNSTLCAGAGLALAALDRPAWGQGQPARRRTIVDAQVHLWKAESEDWKWVPGSTPQMPEPFTIDRAVPLMDEAGVERIVVVPPGSWVGDRNDYGFEAVKRYPGRFAIMGKIPLKDPKSAALLPKWREQPGMLGIRLGGADPWPDWLFSGTEKAGIPIMLQAPEKLSELARAAERHPQLTLILDHLGLTVEMARKKTLGAAIEQVAALAKYPNLSVKIKAGPQYSLEPYPWRDMHPHLRRVFDAFGPQRCYWETDMTNSFNKATYRQRVTCFTEELPFLSEEDKDWIMGRAILERLKWA